MSIYTPDESIVKLRLEDIPAGTTKIYLSECTNLASLPATLPAGLTELYLHKCTSLASLPETLPAGLTKLDLVECTNLVSLPETLPAGLTELNLSWCANLASLPETLPAGLTELNLNWCANLASLPETLPTGLTVLDIHRCTSLASLPETLPAGLTELYLAECTNLASLPETLPAGLTKLNLIGCASLTQSIALLDLLTDLELRNASNPYFHLSWPDHLDHNPGITQIKQKISDAYKSYYALDLDLAEKMPTPDNQALYPTLTLIHRFMTESVVVRGGLEAVIDFMKPVALGIEENPALLEFIDLISLGYLDACINQPVAGFTEIANLVNVASQSGVVPKLEAMRAIIAINLIRKEVTVLGVGTNVQVELANAMLKEVHIKLLTEEEITQPWSGVPDGIAYEAAVNSYLTLENIERITALVKVELTKPISEIANSVLEGTMREFWSSIIMRENKELHEDIIAPVSEKKCQISNLTYEAEDYSTKLESLSEELEVLEKKKIDTISENVKKITFEAIDSLEITSATGPETSPAACAGSSVVGAGLGCEAGGSGGSGGSGSGGGFRGK